MKKIVFAIALAALAVLSPKAAHATCSGGVPYTFVDNASYLTAATTNSNNNFLLACATSVDNSQIGTNGIYASQIIPLNGTQATFGGSQTYTFPTSIIVPATITGGGSGKIVLNDDGTNGYIKSAGAIKLQTNTGGSIQTATLDTSGNFTLPGPAFVHGRLQAGPNLRAEIDDDGSNAYLEGYNAIILISNLAGSSKVLTFDVTGGLTVPGSIAANGYSGGAISGTTGTFSGPVNGASYTGGSISGTSGSFSSNVNSTGTGNFASGLVALSSYMAPTYNPNGSVRASASTWHRVENTVGPISLTANCSGFSVCSISSTNDNWSGSAVFSANPTCVASGNVQQGIWSSAGSTNQVVYNFYNAQSATLSSGTNIFNVHYICEGN